MSQINPYLKRECEKDYSKMVRCAVTLDTSFAQCLNREYRTVNKVMLLNSMYIIPSRINVNKRLAVKSVVKIFIKLLFFA